MRRLCIAVLAFGVGAFSATAQEKIKDNTPPAGFRALFNGKDLTNWQSLAIVKNAISKSGEKKNNLPLWLTNLDDKERAAQQKASDAKFLHHWTVKDGVLEYDGKGKNSLQTIEHFGDFELYVDWKIEANGDSGIYLRGTPQVQIWSVNDKNNPKKVGSGGFYNNQKNPKDPLVVADNPVGTWNTFHIKMIGEKATIKLNGKLVVDDTKLENYWGDRQKPLPERGPIELQDHGDHLWFKNIYVKDLSNANPKS